jgi:hypothetical protein
MPLADRQRKKKKPKRGGDCRRCAEGLKDDVANAHDPPDAHHDFILKRL